MIAANKNYIQKTLTQQLSGLSGVQSNLINLYISNLSNIGTQSAFIAGICFSMVFTILVKIFIMKYKI